MADAKPAVERLSEDESLRGDLSDIGFGPLLDWAVAAVKAYAPQAADSDALDAYTNRVRGVVQSAVQAAQDSKLDDPSALLDFEVDGKDKVLAGLKAVSFGDDPDQNAVQIAAALQTGLTAATEAAAGGAPAPETPQPEKATATPTENPSPATEAAQPASSQASSQEAAQPPPPQSSTEPAQVKASEPGQEAAQAQPDAAQTAPAESTSKQEPAQEAQPVKKNEQEEGEKAGQPPPPEKGLNPEPPANPAPSDPRPGAFLDSLRSRVSQAYSSAWGIFKGFSKRRSG